MNTDESAIMARFCQFAAAYAAKDLPAALSTFSSRMQTSVVFGSGSDTPVSGRAAIAAHLKNEFEHCRIVPLRTRWLSLEVVGSAAWITAISNVRWQSDDKDLTARTTAILVKEPDGWFISHLHFSFASSPPLASGKAPPAVEGELQVQLN
ncbi:MAG: YybH family protein [Limisphaerales bacterium]